MPDMGAGSRLYQKSIGVDSATFSPLSDRAGVIRRILLDKVSVSDAWTISVNGQEVGTYIENTTGDNQLLSAPSGAFPKNNDLFAFCQNVLNDPLTYPVEQGQTLSISSAGGATADVLIGYEEFVPSAISSTLENASGSKRWYAPLYFSLAASVTTPGEKAIDTQGGLSFVPPVFLPGTFAQGWTVTIVALFLQGLGVNTFSGSADHLSATDHLALVKNGQRLFTRDALDGIPLVGSAAAGSSANTVYGADFTPFPAFQTADVGNWVPLDPPLVITQGSSLAWYLGILGDLTGGADYSGALHVALCHIRES